MNIFRYILGGETPVHVVDSRAQGDKLFTAAVEEFDLFTLCQAYGVKITVLVFPSDELESLVNLRDLVKCVAHRVNFVIVENPARNETRLFQNSSFQRTLVELGARTIRLPVITSPTMLAMEQVEHSLKRGISFAEFATPTTRHLDPIMTSELGMVLAKMYSQYDAIADVLVPPSYISQIKAVVKTPTTEVNSDSEEMFGFSFPI